MKGTKKNQMTSREQFEKEKCNKCINKLCNISGATQGYKLYGKPSCSLFNRKNIQ